MLERLVPSSVATAEAYDDLAAAPLWPGEDALVRGAVPRRAREFATTRDCARRALRALGVPPVAVLSGPARAPAWPDGVVGSLTHCDGFRGAAVASGAEVQAVGIDAEPHAPLPEGVGELIATAPEQPRLTALVRASPAVEWDRLLFCAKEAIYKAWFPATGRWLNFGELEVVLSPSGWFTARLVDPEDPAADLVGRLRGRWLVEQDLVLAAALALAV